MAGGRGSSSSSGSQGGAEVEKPVRRTLVEQQGDTPKDTAGQATRSIAELDVFATRMMAKKKKILEDAEKDMKEIRYLQGKIEEETRKYAGLTERLDFRYAERRRIQTHLANCRDMNDNLMTTAHSATWSAKREDSNLLKSRSSATLRMARGFGTDPSSTFTRKDMRNRLTAAAAGSSGRGVGASRGGMDMRASQSTASLIRTIG